MAKWVAFLFELFTFICITVMIINSVGLTNLPRWRRHGRSEPVSKIKSPRLPIWPSVGSHAGIVISSLCTAVYLMIIWWYLMAIQLLSSRRSPSVYKVTNSQGKVVSLCLFKTNYRLGEDIIGTLDFTDGVVSCMQVPQQPIILASCISIHLIHPIKIILLANNWNCEFGF